MFFYIDFDENGAADPRWNIPLRHLAERAGRGPDLGAGPIRLACRSQSPVPWHQIHLWDPELSPENNQFLMIRDAVKRNSLGLLFEESPEHSFAIEQFTFAAEESWGSALQMGVDTQVFDREKNQAQRQKAAQIIKQQRLRISSLEAQHAEQLATFRVQHQSVLAVQQRVLELEKQLAEQELLNAQLKQQLQE